MSPSRGVSATGRRTIVVRTLVLLAVVAVGAVTIAVIGGDRDDPATRAELASPEDFATRIGHPATFLINVHTPYEGEIAGTEVFIAFDQIDGDPRLPADKDTEILLYCRSGRMSAVAADVLVEAGFTNVVDLEGGMVAWEAAGMTVIHAGR